MKTKLIVSGILLFAFAGTALAQSTVTGTLTGGSSGSTLSGTVGSGSGTLSGTVGSGSGTLTGTVTAPPSSGGGGGGGGTGGGGGGGGGSAVVTDYCPNIDGLQSSLPAGYGIQNGQCILLTAAAGGTGSGVGGGGGEVLGASTEAPNVPNTGAGGNAGATLLVLALLALATAGGVRYLQLSRRTT